MAKNYYKIIFVSMALFIVASSSAYAAPDWWPIVPCGLNEQPAGSVRMDTLGNGKEVPHDFTKDCNQCDIILLLKNLIDLTTYGLVPVLGTFFFILGGFYILIGGGTGNPGRVEEGKKLMKNTAYGIAIILSSWLITNMILKSVANDQIASTPWYQISCRVGNLKELTEATVPKVGQPATPATPAQPGTGIQCKYSGVNLCEAKSMTCSNASCAQYSASIKKYADKWGIEANLVKAVMMKESSCNARASNAGGNSHGLMAFIPSTAKMVGQFCGVSPSNAGNPSWLTDPKNSDAVICMGAYYLSSIGPKGQCGSNVQNIAAGYNAGPGYCKTSVDCGGEKSCTDGGPKRKWECLYDNPQHTVCNTRLNESKDYAPKILFCYNNPGF